MVGFTEHHGKTKSAIGFRIWEVGIVFSVAETLQAMPTPVPSKNKLALSLDCRSWWSSSILQTNLCMERQDIGRGDCRVPEGRGQRVPGQEMPTHD